MRKLVCILDLFVVDQKIFLVDENNYTCVGSADINTLPNILRECCELYDVAYIHLFGNAQYAFGIKEEVQLVLENIEIEVN